MKRLVGILAVSALVVFAVPLISASPAIAGPSAVMEYHISDAYIASFGEPQTGARATAGNVAPNTGNGLAGDHVSLTGSGAFNTANGRASGEGSFTHYAPDGTTVKARATWTANRLLGFEYYGCLPKGSGAERLCGGRALLGVTIFRPSGGPLSGLLSVTCLIGSPPAGAKEGITLESPGHVNFNETEESDQGETVFVVKSKGNK